MLSFALLLALAPTALPLPLPPEGADPVAISVSLSRELGEQPDMVQRLAQLRRSIRTTRKHVRLAEHRTDAAVRFVITSYEIEPLSGDRERHRIDGHYSSANKWEPFHSISESGRPGLPPGLGRFVETVVFGAELERYERQHPDR